MNLQTHWENVYRSKRADTVSWYRPHLERSLELIRRSAPESSSAIIDVGGGESTLVDDLLGAGYRDITVLDISAVAIEHARERAGERAAGVTWLAADITQAALPERRYDVWHDRAVFHFLTDPAKRAAYVRQVARAVKPGGFVIVATFGSQGPLQCSGLDVVRYDADGLHGEFGSEFRLLESSTEVHQTPAGKEQPFLYCYCRLDSVRA
jgi:2-polyprenyl-3-methyl-5-hydroxy-6-metoxy-1,4-benzoquinol methylase